MSNSPEPPRRGPSKRRMRVLFAVLCLIWGSTWLIVKRGVQDLPPFTSAGMRMGLAAVVMAVVAHLLERREDAERPPLRLSLVMGLGNFALTYGLVYWASTVLPSGVVALLWAVYPMMMAITAHFYLHGEKLAPRQWLGFVAGIAGVWVLKADLDEFGRTATSVALLVLLSPLAACLSTAVIKKHGGRYSSNLLNRDGLIIATVPLGALAFLFERDAVPHWSGFAVFSVVYLAVVGTVVTFGIYYYLLRWAPAHQLSLIAFVTPAIAMALGAALGNEPYTPRILAGAGIILVGVLLVVLRRH